MDVLEELRQAQLLRKEQAREQAYLARVAQLEKERGERELAAAAAQEGGDGDENDDTGTEEAAQQERERVVVAAEGPAAPAAEGAEESGRKRRRQVRVHMLKFSEVLTFNHI